MSEDQSFAILRKYYFNMSFIKEQHAFGGDWELEVALSGPINSQTDLVVNLNDLDKIINPILQSLNEKRPKEVFKKQKLPHSFSGIFLKWLFEEIQKKMQRDPHFSAVRLRNLKLVEVPRYENWTTYGH